MRRWRRLRLLVLACLSLAPSAALPLAPASAQTAARDSVEIAGRTVRCQGVRIVTDNGLPSEGAAAPGVLVLNPRMLNGQPTTVRLFVFHHECGHHAVGESELKADCWAVDQGVRGGWLDANGVSAVCRSFEDAPETPTHPSGRRRCRNLDQCFAKTMASLRTRNPASAAVATPATARPAESTHQPKLVSGPTLIGTGTLRYSGSGPCRDASDKVTQGGARPAAGCP